MFPLILNLFQSCINKFIENIKQDFVKEIKSFEVQTFWAKSRKVVIKKNDNFWYKIFFVFSEQFSSIICFCLIDSWSYF